MLSGLVMIIFENSKLFEGLVILNKQKGKTRQPQSYLSPDLFRLVSSLLFSCLPSCLLLSLVSSLVFSVSVCLSVSVCCCVLFCVVVVCVCCGVCCGACCGACCGVCGGTLEKPVCRFKTTPCARSKRPRVCRHHVHMCYHMRAWCRYTRGRVESTHGEQAWRRGVIVGSAYQNLPTYGYHLTQEVHQRNSWILHIFSLRIDRE